MYLLIALFIIYLFYEFNPFFYRLILKCIGFQIDPNIFKDLPNEFIFIGTHTSMVDFFIGTFIYYGYLHKKYSNHILMKDEFEKYSSSFFTNFDNKLKIIPVEKEKKGLTQKIINKLQHHSHYLLFISPEGTRKYTENLKSGYWAISKELDINVVFIGIDFYHKTLKLEKPRKVSPLWEEEKKIFKESAKKYQPLFPENCAFFHTSLLTK